MSEDWQISCQAKVDGIAYNILTIMHMMAGDVIAYNKLLEKKKEGKKTSCAKYVHGPCLLAYCIRVLIFYISDAILHFSFDLINKLFSWVYTSIGHNPSSFTLPVET